MSRISREDWALFILRLVGLPLALSHGWGKVLALASGEGGRFLAGVEALGFPAPLLFAWAAALAEFAGGLALALGIWVRPWAAFAAFTMAVAAFKRHHALDHWLVALGLKDVPAATVESWGNPEMALLYLIPLVAILLLGAGRISLGQLLGRGRKSGA